MSVGWELLHGHPHTLDELRICQPRFGLGFAVNRVSGSARSTTELIERYPMTLSQHLRLQRPHELSVSSNRRLNSLGRRSASERPQALLGSPAASFRIASVCLWVGHESLFQHCTGLLQSSPGRQPPSCL